MMEGFKVNKSVFKLFQENEIKINRQEGFDWKKLEEKSLIKWPC